MAGARELILLYDISNEDVGNNPTLSLNSPLNSDYKLVVILDLDRDAVR